MLRRLKGMIVPVRRHDPANPKVDSAALKFRPPPTIQEQFASYVRASERRRAQMGDDSLLDAEDFSEDPDPAAPPTPYEEVEVAELGRTMTRAEKEAYDMGRKEFDELHADRIMQKRAAVARQAKKAPKKEPEE